MTVVRVLHTKDYLGLSSDVKPTTGVEPGSTFGETDTGVKYTYSGSTWSVTPHSGVVSVPYLGQVATRCYVPNGVTGNLTVMSVNMHVAKDDLTALQLIFANWASTSSEAGGSGTCAFTAAIEYPAGTIAAQVTFGGAVQGVAAIASSLTSDMVPLNVVIPNGAKFWTRVYAVNAGANSFIMNQLGSTLTDRLEVNSTDKTMLPGASIANATTSTLTPIAILGRTTKASVLIIGDSIAQGAFDANTGPTGPVDQGILARSIGQVAGYINAACSGEQAGTFVSSHTKRLALAQYCSHVACNYGINDIRAAANAATTLARLVSIAALFPDKPFYQTTMTPLATSSDLFVTTANQSVTAAEPERIILNASIRNGSIPGMAGFFDVEAALESSYRSGLWQVQPGTIAPATAAFCNPSDGVHPNKTGYMAVMSSGRVPAGAFRR